jgi:transposase
MAFASVGQWLEWLWMDLTDIQWQQIKRFIPGDPVRPDRRGRPWSDQRQVLNGILWILRTGAPWKDLPARYGAYQTVHRRFTRWRKQGIIKTVLQGLAEDLHKRGGFDLSECFIDGSFAPAKKGGLAWARPSAARAVKSWSLETLLVFQSPSTVKLLRPVK